MPKYGAVPSADYNWTRPFSLDIVAAGARWPSVAGVPSGKIYEVFGAVQPWNFLCLNGDVYIAMYMPDPNESVTPVWFPANVNVTMEWVGGYGYTNICTKSEGWILTEGEWIWGSADWAVRWREVQA